MAEHTPDDGSNQTAVADTMPAALSSEAAPEAPSETEVAAVIAELEQYRARLVEDFTNTAKKAKLPKSMTLGQLETHPEILKIDTALAQLRGDDADSQDADSQDAESQALPESDS